jgi:hypothetical protein
MLCLPLAQVSAILPSGKYYGNVSLEPMPPCVATLILKGGLNQVRIPCEN